MADGGGVPWYHVNVRLLPVKLFYFFFLAAAGDLLPFIPLYMKQIELTPSQTGVIYGIMPFVGFLVRPLFGVLADKFQKHKLVLALTCIFTGVFYLLILVIPTDHVSYIPVKTQIICNQYDSYIHDCFHDNQTNCPMNYINFIENEQNLQNHVAINDSVTTGSPQISNFTSPSHISYLSGNYGNIPKIGCSVVCTSSITTQSKVCFSDQVEQSDEGGCLGAESMASNVHFTIHDILHSTREVIADRQRVGDLECRDSVLKNITTGHQTYWNLFCSTNLELNCHMKCDKGMSQKCLTREAHDQRDRFILLLVVYLFGNIAFAPVLSLGDTLAYDILGEDKRGHWGKQRLFGTVGFMIFALTSTFIMYMISGDNIHIDFSVSFYMFGGLCLLSAMTTLFMSVSSNISSSNMIKHVLGILKHTQIVLFLSVVFFFGMLNGAIETFLYWFLEEQTSGYFQLIPGFCLAINCTIETGLLYLSGVIIKRLGHLKCIYIVFLAYAVRMMAYSFITNAYFVLPIEMLHGITFGIMWATCTSYASIISPPGVAATVQGLLGGIHFGFGKGIGSLTTGWLYDRIGSRWTWRVYSLASLVLFLLYLFLNKTVLRKSDRESVIDNQKEYEIQESDKRERQTKDLKKNHYEEDIIGTNPNRPEIEPLVSSERDHTGVDEDK